MDSPQYSIRYTFSYSGRHEFPISFNSHDFCGNYGLPQPELPPTPITHYRQEKTIVYDHLLNKLGESNFPGKEYVISYLKDKYRRNLSPRTLLASVYSVRLFLLFLEKNGRRDILDLSRRDIEAYVEHEQDRGLKVLSIKTRLVSLYAFLNFLVKSHVLPPMILERKIRIKTPSSLPRAIAFDDLTKFLSGISEIRDRALIMLLLRTGMRIGELLALQVTDINLDEQKICIYIGEKNAQGRVVYFCDDAKEALLAWLRIRNPEAEPLFYGRNSQPLSYAGARKLFLKHLKKAGLAAKGYSIHQLRHTFATELLNVGMRLEVLQQLLGHSTIEMTRHYARLTDKTREEEYFRAINRIEREGSHGLY
ncbi:MAG: tyrosine-type recombinase/integrase [Proteobacteria bacterium]|nr:tyrosine-type recombinase/integrase [Pseudomonadota bacterium]MBU1737940.1 tyrosine-type recombinase/integrase [Pseudomonadota bacterium]